MICAPVLLRGATAPTSEVRSRSIAWASSRVRVCVPPAPVEAPWLLTAPGDTVSMLRPSEAISWATRTLAPSPMATVATTAETAMTMPTMASAERSLLRRSASIAVRTEARKFMPAPRRRGAPAGGAGPSRRKG